MTDAIFDMQVKRIHEYKRQLMNVLSIVHRYAVICSCLEKDRYRIPPRVVVLAGKGTYPFQLVNLAMKKPFQH